MTLTIDIPNKLLREAIMHTGKKTGGEVVVTAIMEFNRRCRLKEMAERLHGSLPNFMTQKDLRAKRGDSKRKSEL